MAAGTQLVAAHSFFCNTTMSVANLFTFSLILLSSQDCWGGEITKDVICGNLSTGNAYRYCVDVEDESKRNLCVEWMHMFPNETYIELAGLCQQKNTTQASHVIDVNYFCITLPECVNVTYIDRLIELWIEFKVSGASDEPKEPLEKAPDSQSKTADNVKQDVDNENPNHNNTRTWLIPLCVCIAVVVVVVIAGLLYVCVYKPSRNKERNQGHRDVEEGQGNPDPNSIPLNQNEQCDASDQGEEGILGVEDGKPSDNDRADTESRQKTHADSPPLNVPKVVSQTDDAQLLGQPQSNGHVGMDVDPGQGAGETSPLLCRSPGEDGVLEGQDMKPADSGGTDPESCQKTHAEPPLVNGQHDVSVNDKSKEPTADAQSPGPPQMNGGPPISNRAAEETTALLDKQALNKDQVTKPPELIDKGPNDMESRREL